MFIFFVNNHILIKMTKLAALNSHASKHNPLVVVISGPSGVGKDAVIDKIRGTGFKIHYVVTATTRRKRHNEKDGVHYHFITPVQFRNRIKKGEFLEYAVVYGNYYGVLKSEVIEALKKGNDVVIKVDVQGAETLKQKIPGAIFIFVLPESLTDLSSRLIKRNADSSSDMDLRLSIARAELKQKSWFDYSVVNYRGRLNNTVAKIKCIIEAERCRVKLRKVAL